MNILCRFTNLPYTEIKTSDEKYNNEDNKRYSYTSTTGIAPWWWNAVKDLSQLTYTDGTTQYVLYYKTDVESNGWLNNNIDEVVTRKEMSKIFNRLRKYLEEVLL
jgi:hypothetical protein